MRKSTSAFMFLFAAILSCHSKKYSPSSFEVIYQIQENSLITSISVKNKDDGRIRRYVPEDIDAAEMGTLFFKPAVAPSEKFVLFQSSRIGVFEYCRSEDVVGYIEGHRNLNKFKIDDGQINFHYRFIKWIGPNTILLHVQRGNTSGTISVNIENQIIETGNFNEKYKFKFISN